MLIDRQTLLGIGVGLLLAATLSAAGGHRSARVSDLEVIRRAKELGMSFQGEQRLALPGGAATPATGQAGRAPAGEAAPVSRPSAPSTSVPQGPVAGQPRGERTAPAKPAPVTEAKTYRFPRNVRVRDLVSALLAGPRPQ